MCVTERGEIWKEGKKNARQRREKMGLRRREKEQESSHIAFLFLACNGVKVWYVAKWYIREDYRECIRETLEIF